MFRFFFQSFWLSKRGKILDKILFSIAFRKGRASDVDFGFPKNEEK